MNKKGQNLLFAILFAVMVFFAGMLMMNHLKDTVSYARTLGIDCSNPDLTSGTKLTCLGIDLVIPITILLVISISAGLILERFVL